MARPFPKSALLARNTRLLSKNAGRRITFGVRFNMMPSYSGAKDLSTNPATRRRARCRADHGILKRAGNRIDAFRGAALKYAQELPASNAYECCLSVRGDGTHEKAA
jgi:hypothetical protein